MLYKDLIKDILSQNVSDTEKISLINSLTNSSNTYEDEFNNFLNLYFGDKKPKNFPKKEIHKKFIAILNSGCDIKDIMRGLKSYKDTIKDINFMIQPRRFLNEKMWNNFNNKIKEKSKEYYIDGNGIKIFI